MGTGHTELQPIYHAIIRMVVCIFHPIRIHPSKGAREHAKTEGEAIWFMGLPGWDTS